MRDRGGAGLLARPPLFTVPPRADEGLTRRSGFLTGTPEMRC